MLEIAENLKLMKITTNITHEHNIEKCKDLLERAGFKRTTSRRFIRYEREAKTFFGDAYTEGVEIKKYSAMNVLSVYTRRNEGVIIPLDATSKLSLYIDNIFENYQYTAQ